MIPMHAASVSAAVCEHTAINTLHSPPRWKLNSNMTARERTRTKKNIYSERDNKLCTNSRVLKDVLSKDHIQLENSVRRVVK